MSSVAKLVSKQNLSLFIFVFVNFLFSIKYLSRLTPFYLPCSILIGIVYIILWKKKKEINRFLAKLHLSVNWLLLAYVACCLVLFYFIPKESLNVDRWSVITAFWDHFFDGKYVYYAQSFDGNYPGPMPFYFILALPFYIIGELGLFSLAGIVVFVVLMQNNKQQIDQELIAFLFIAASLCYVWEICSRSNIFVNGTLVLWSVVYFFKAYEQTFKKNILFGLIIGLLLSTRNVFLISYVIMFLYAFRMKRINLNNGIALCAFSLLFFGLSFVPFIWNHVPDFLTMNPFIIQSSYLMPFEYTLLFLSLSILFSFFCKQSDDVYFYTGINLFLTILFYFVYTMLQSSFSVALYESKGDVSYFILCIPFFVFYLFSKENIGLAKQ